MTKEMQNISFYYKVFFLDKIPIKVSIFNMITFLKENKHKYSHPEKVDELIVLYKAMIKRYCI